MRINSHAHIFNLRSVFTVESLSIFLNRLKLDKMPKSFVEDLQGQLGKYLKKEINAEKVFEKLDEKLQISEELSSWVEKIKIGSTNIDIEIDGVLAKLGAVSAKYLRKKILNLYDLDENGEIKQDWLDYIEFLRIALLPSIENVADVVREQMKPDDLLVALMMDITDGSEDDTLINQQIKDTSDVVLAYPGAVLPFFMVNPFRPSYFDLMKNAIENLGFWGIKLYPSLGYPVVSEKMFRVYDYCEANKIPILTHCTPQGFRKNKHTSDFASPEPWVKVVLKKFQDLKVCFGHFGGEISLIQEDIPSDSWTGQIIDMMKKFQGVYADISSHKDPIIGNEEEGISRDIARENYLKNMKELLKSSSTQKRILFGTDYWMVRSAAKDEDYWAFFEKLFTPTQFKRISETNPIEYLGIPGAKVESNWLIERHLSFFKNKKMRVQRPPVKWLADSAVKILGPDMRFVPIGGPSWSDNNYIHRILFEYFWKGNLFRKADKDLKLTFEEYGRFKLGNLTYWDESLESVAFETAVRMVASNIDEMMIVRYKKWTYYKKTEGITKRKARQRLMDALKNMDWYVYQLAELCDKLYVYKFTLPKEFN